ncbi:MAG: DUF6273 domain-containing protein [Clostridiales bacterium]|nr:DUF6273 domain-containing protein [Clostridiales bacterium]
MEDYTDSKNWNMLSPKLDKTVSVANVGDVLDNYYSAYVRVSLKEFMQIYETKYNETEHRYMVYDGVRHLFDGETTKINGSLDGKGHFVTFSSESAALAAYPGHVIMQLTDCVTGDSGFMVRTQAGDEDGQYGRYVVTSIDDQVPLSTPIIPPCPVGVGDDGYYTDEKQAPSAPNGQHHEVKNGECLYPETYLYDLLNGSNADISVTKNIREYVDMIIPANVKPLSWFVGANNSKPYAGWIYDDTTTNTDPYIYWGQFLAPGESTADLMEAIELLKRPGDNFYYALHVDMQAISLDELLTSEWNTELKQSYIDYAPGVAAHDMEVPEFEDILLKNYVITPNDIDTIDFIYPSSDLFVKHVMVDGVETAFENGKINGMAAGVYSVTLILNSGDRATFKLTVTEIPPEFTLYYSEGNILMDKDRKTLTVNLTSPIGAQTIRYFSTRGLDGVTAYSYDASNWVLNGDGIVAPEYSDDGTFNASFCHLTIPFVDNPNLQDVDICLPSGIGRHLAYGIIVKPGYVGTFTLNVGAYKVTFNVTAPVGADDAARAKSYASSLKVGDTFAASGIEWRVLHKESGESLVITENSYGNQTMHSTNTAYDTSINWMGSRLRADLNSDVHSYSYDNLSFKSAIKEVTLYTRHGADSVNYTGATSITNDHVFLLSEEEVSGARANASQPVDLSYNIYPNKILFPDSYSKRDVHVSDGSQNGYNWLRSPYNNSGYVTTLQDANGNFNAYFVIGGNAGVRPACVIAY